MNEGMSATPTRRTPNLVLASLGELCAGAGVALGGELNPPAGPVAPTHKTLTQVEPRIEINAVHTPGDADSLFRISQPGSYYLTGNVTGAASKRDIEIAASTVSNNHCGNNGAGAGIGAGIFVSGGGNRIKGNHCSAGDTGIDVGGSGNIIVRNTCAGNMTHWVVAANNVFDPVLDRTAPASGAFSGSAAASTLGTTDPNANFTY